MRELIAERDYLRLLYDEHMEDNDGELLAHLLMADICRWVIAQREADPIRVLQLLLWLEAHLETLMQSQDPVDNVICASFIEHLPLSWEPGSEVLGLLGPKMKAVYNQIFL